LVRASPIDGGTSREEVLMKGYHRKNPRFVRRHYCPQQHPVLKTRKQSPCKCPKHAHKPKQ
jgi:hypothetical protein